MGVSINGGTPKWMVYKGKSHLNGWFRGTPILGNFHLQKKTATWVWYVEQWLNSTFLGQCRSFVELNFSRWFWARCNFPSLVETYGENQLCWNLWKRITIFKSSSFPFCFYTHQGLIPMLLLVIFNRRYWGYHSKQSFGELAMINWWLTASQRLLWRFRNQGK